MPVLDTEIAPTSFGANRLEMGNISGGDMDRITRSLSPTDYGTVATIGGDAALGVADLADTVASSIPFLSKSFGLERGTVNSAMLRAIDSPGLQDFYNNNRGGIEAASGIYGIIGAELAARRVTAPLMAGIGALKSLPWARRIASLDQQYERAMKVVRTVDTSIAARGALGAEQFVGKMILPSEGLAGLGLGARAGEEIGRSRALWGAKAIGAAKGVRNAAVTEGIMAMTMNQNGFLYTDDYMHNAMWMGFGLGAAGAFESIATSYAIRKAVNGDEIRRTFANALDPDGSEAMRTNWANRAVDPKKFKGLGDIPDGQGFLGGTFTDNVTNMLMGIRAKTGTGVDDLSREGMGLFSNRGRLATQEYEQARIEIQKVTMKGIEGNGYARFGNKTANSTGAMNHIDQLMKRDPGAFYGLEEIGVAQARSSNQILDAIATHEGRDARINQIIEDAHKTLDDSMDEDGHIIAGEEKAVQGAEDTIKRYRWKQKFVPVPFIDGERATITDLQGLAGWVEPEVVKSQLPDKVSLWEAKTEAAQARVGLDANGKTYLPGNKALKDTDHFDVLRLYRLGQQMIDEAKNGVVHSYALAKDADHFQLDLAEQILRANPKAKIQFPEGMTRESAQVESFAQKAEMLAQEARKAKIREVTSAKKGIEYDPSVEASKLRVRLNLPRLSAYERGILARDDHPLEQLLRGAAEYGPDEIRKLSLQDLMKGAADMKRIGDFAPTAASDFKDLHGNSFRYMLDEFNQPTKPILAYSRPLDPHEWATDWLGERMAAARMDVMGDMVKGDTFNARLSQAIMGSSDMDAVSRTRELMETQVQGSVIGSNHLGIIGAAIKGVKARDWIGRDNPILLAASRLQQMVSNLARDNFQQEAKGLHGVASLLDSPRNTATKLMLNTYLHARPGWDLLVKKGVVQTTEAALPNGTKVRKMVLADTEENATRWKEQFGAEMPKGAHVTLANGKEAVLDDMGMSFMDELDKMTDSIRVNKNQMLAAQGLKQIEKLPHYVPPTNIDGKFIGFTVDNEGNTVRGMTVIAATEKEFVEQQDKILAQIEKRGLTGYRFRTQQEIKDFADIWDRAQMDMIDPGTTPIQGGKRQTGRLAQPDIDMKGVEGVLNTVRSQYLKHSQDVLELTMRDQLRSAEARSQIASSLSRNAANPDADQKYRGIHAMYIENLTGRSPLQSKGSIIGSLYNPIEGKLDQAIAAATPGFSRVWTAVNGFADRAHFWRKTDAAKRDFDSLSRHLGPYMPFESSANYVERLSAGTMPPQLKDMLGLANRFTAGIMLRVMEPMMAVMNMSGMINAMPAVIRHVQQQAGETAADHALRVGHISTIFEGAGRNGENIGVLNMGKIAASGFKRAWKRTSEADYEYMRRNGMLTQEVAEFQRQFGAIETKKDWERFMFGDENASKIRANAPKVGEAGALFNRATTKKGLMGWMSILTDKSEDFSRSWGHMVGLELAEHLGIAKMEAKHAFAHDIANKMIANYNPANRPEVWQGALGAPLGLFQSFALNYYQRMFRYVESRDLASAGIQSAMQGSMFGITTIPGANVVSKLFFDHTGGDDDPVAAIQSKFGASAGDLIFGGVLSNIPKLFGQEGVDLYSRGDVAVRMPTIMGVPAATATGNMLAGSVDMMKLIAKGIKGFITGNPQVSANQLAEVASNTIPNRPIAGIIEQFFAGGNDVDKVGQIASKTTSVAESIYRMMGVRSMRQSKELEAFYQSRNRQSLQASMKDQLKLATRAAFRAKDYDKIPTIFEQYIENGGDPRNARRWMIEQFKAATQTRGERMLQQSLKSQDKMAYAIRLLDAGVSVDDDETTEPYADSLNVDSSEFGQVNENMMDYDDNSVDNTPVDDGQ